MLELSLSHLESIPQSYKNYPLVMLELSLSHLETIHQSFKNYPLVMLELSISHLETILQSSSNYLSVILELSQRHLGTISQSTGAMIPGSERGTVAVILVLLAVCLVEPPRVVVVVDAILGCCGTELVALLAANC